MPVGVRELTLIGEFKPFGLIAEALDGKPSNDISDKFDYFLFNPKSSQELQELDERDASATAFTQGGDHELFIRDNRCPGSQKIHITVTSHQDYDVVCRLGNCEIPLEVLAAGELETNFTLVCWCVLGTTPETLLCVLQTGCLTLYNISGEVVSIPIPHTITTIWPLPFGLVLQHAAEVTLPIQNHFSSSSPLLGKHEIYHSRKDASPRAQPNFSPMRALDLAIKSDPTKTSSHLILNDVFEEPQLMYLEERGKFKILKDFDERTIWTSNQIPIMASYNQAKMQHSVWVAEAISSNLEVAIILPTEEMPASLLPKKCSFRRVWQGKGAHSSASKVFLATDDDTTPVICFLLQEHKKLLSVRLQAVDINSEIIFDVKPDMSWSISAVAAAPIMVTRPSVKVGLLPYADIIVLGPDNNLLLYTGKQCLCRYLLPSHMFEGDLSPNMKFPQRESSLIDLKIIGLTDAMDGCINVATNSGKMFRCALRRSPSSSLADDCITAMAEGISSDFYNYFLGLLWGEGDLTNVSKADCSTNSEWHMFCNVLLHMCRPSNFISEKTGSLLPPSSWDFLVNSKFHKNYNKLKFISGISYGASHEGWETDSLRPNMDCVQSSEKDFHPELLKEALNCLHALYECLKLDVLRKRDLEFLAVLLCNIASCLGEGSYLDHYVRDFPGPLKKFRTCKPALSPASPSSLFRWLEKCLRDGCSSANIDDLPQLVRKDESYAVSRARKIVSFYSLLCGAKRAGKKLSSGVYCKIAMGSYCSNEEHTVLAMVGERFGLQQVDSLPSGVSLPLRHALDKCREAPPTDWPAAAYVLLGREDLALSCSTHSAKSKELGAQMDVNLISMSTPYILHLHPVVIPSTVCDTIGVDSTMFENTDTFDGLATDGMEHIFNSSTQLQYGRDFRLNEVRRLLCSARPVVIQTPGNPSASDQDLQQAQLWHVAQRTTALPLGRGAFTLGTIYTLLTEAFTVPKLVLAGRLPAQQNATVNLDPNIRNIQELKSWPEFHNAVAAGLRLGPLQGKMSRTWIIYNKPEEPNAVHGGLLLALGLQGYLHVLTISDIYQYLQQEHESTTVGLILGLAASYRGTMQPAISKSVYVHIPARHSSSCPELELPTLLQSAALMSVGLLYEGSAHPQTMQILMGEIGRRSGGDNVLEREGHAVSAGFSLGLVALGRGKDPVGSMETMVDRLFQYIGGKTIPTERFPSLISSTDEQIRLGQMLDGTTVNVDVTAPAATVAITLMFLKTESEVIASRLSIPETHFGLQYVRPDFIMLRVIARNLIMWSRIQASKNWVQSQIPEIIKSSISGLHEDCNDIDDMDGETFVQAYINIVTGSCIAIGLRYAGTMDGNAQELLYEYAVYFLNEIKLVSPANENTLPKGLLFYVDRGTLEICLHLIVLSLSVVMAGSGHLQTFRLLRFLRSRNSSDGQANYGIQMAVSLAIGFLFLGGGMRTFSRSNSSIAALLITLYPRLPAGPNDNRCHLQAFRHLYVLATEARWIKTVDVDSGLPVYAPLEVTIMETEHYSETSLCEVTPCILPERGILRRIRVCGPRYWPQVIEFVPEEKSWWSFRDKNNPFDSGVLYIKRKVGACSYVDDPIGCQSLLSRAMHKVFGLTSSNVRDPSIGNMKGPDSMAVDQLISTFSSDPSLIAFAQLCNPSSNSRSDVYFEEFCLQVLFECVSKDQPALLTVYLSLYDTIGSMVDLVANGTTSLGDSLSIGSLKLALTYNEAILSGKLATSKGGVVQSVFLGSLRKRVEDLFKSSQGLTNDLSNYLNSGRWPEGESNSVILSWYLQWYGVPASSVVKVAVDKIKPRLLLSSSSVPLLCLLLPATHINAIRDIDKLLCSS